MLDAGTWRTIRPNEHGDWVNQRSDRFEEFSPLHDDDDPNSIFLLRTNGSKTNRDAWNYNSSRAALEANAERMVAFFNSEVDRFNAAHPNLTGTVKAKAEVAKAFVNLNETKFSWDRSDFQRVGKGETLSVELSQLYETMYRPFQRQHGNVKRALNNTVYRLPHVYPAATASGITNDPNDWATEHDQPSYIYDLLCSVVTVSMRTLELIGELPPLDLT